MPTIFDNIEEILSERLCETIKESYKSDFCVGYFNLRGWKNLTAYIDKYSGGEDNCCRLLIGMQRPPQELLKEYLAPDQKEMMDQAKAVSLRTSLAREFRKQLMFGIPRDEDEQGLRKLAQQLREQKVVVKLYLRHPLHAKLYLLYRQDRFTPLIGYLGSSNLTMSGLHYQGELNIDVMEQDAAGKLEKWFNDRWNDKYCLDISEELANIIDESWAGEKLVKPYYIYLKTAYYLSREAQLGLNNYLIPDNFKDVLLPFQQGAVLIAARHLDRRRGVIISDVVGLGKTLTACALTKLFEETFFLETLVICPKNLVSMWEDHLHEYQIRGKVKSISTINEEFIKERRYRVIVIDESHNLRNREGKRYGFIKDYIEQNECRVILLTATPYNKTYHDLSSQLRLFIPENQDLGVSPEQYIASIGGIVEFKGSYQYSPNSILAFEKSEFTDDWRTLLRMYMIRRTRTFIKNNYAQYDDTRKQHYLQYPDGGYFYFPERIPRKIEYNFDPADPDDVYATMYSMDVVKAIESLNLPRYGLGNFIDEDKKHKATKGETEIIENLSRAGKQLMGFCRTNLFKRLESSGIAFIKSLVRHIVRNNIFIYAIENDLPLPIGSQEAGFIDEFLEESDAIDVAGDVTAISSDKLKAFQEAEPIYKTMEAKKSRYGWIKASLFREELKDKLSQDVEILLDILQKCRRWDSSHDKKVESLEKLVRENHCNDKIIIFTQFADTASYLEKELKRRGMEDTACVTGSTENPKAYVDRFSPRSNNKEGKINDEIRIIISTDILSEGQNLQDAHIVVNFDLPWALIRLVQRVGRVDRIGQHSPEIISYCFLPAEGVEKIIALRKRLAQRIKENAEVVGSDETFFDGDPVVVQDLYNEKSGILDEEEDQEVDLTSTAYEIWNQATKARPELKRIIPDLSDVLYATRPQPVEMMEGEGVITYHRTPYDVDALNWLDREGNIISKSQLRILRAMECDYDTPALEKLEQHHALVEKSIELARRDEVTTGGQLGKKTGARFKTYMTLIRHQLQVKNTLFDTEDLNKTIDDIYNYPIQEGARNLINRRMKLGITDTELAELAMSLRDSGRLCIITEEREKTDNTPRIICSMGIKNQEET